MKSIILILIIFNFAISCRAPKIIPEVSKNIYIKRIDIVRDIDSPVMLSSKNKILFINRLGKIYSYEAGKKDISQIFDTKETVRRVIFYSKNISVIKTTTPNKIMIFNSLNSRITKLNDHRGRIIFVNEKLIISVYRKKIIVKNYKSGVVPAKISIKKERIISSASSKQNIYILGSGTIYKFSYGSNEFIKLTLPVKAISGFALKKNNIYFGSKERLFCKFNLIKKKIVWKIPIQMSNLRPVIKFKKYLVLTPKDNSVYFYSSRGSLIWWTKINSEILSEPIAMKDFIAVHTRDGETEKIIFLNPVKKQSGVITLENIKLNYPAIFNNGYLYAAGIDSLTRTFGLYIAGNRIGGILKIPKMSRYEINKSIKIAAEPVNMINPTIKISIINNIGDIITEESFSSDEQVKMAWVPEKEGKYFIRLFLKGKFNEIEEEKQEIEIFDFKKFFNKYYLNLFRSCTNGRK